MGTQLEYQIVPGQVFVSTTTDLTLICTNPVNGSPIQFQGGRDPSVIEFTIPVGPKDSDLTPAATFTVATSSDGFTVTGRSGGVYQIAPNLSSGATLNPGDSIRVSIRNVAVSSSTCDAIGVPITEYIGMSPVAGGVNLSKVNPSLGIYAWLVPDTVGESGSSTLWWQSSGGTEVTISGTSTGSFDNPYAVKGNPPHTESVRVSAPIGQSAQTTFTLTVSATGKAPQPVSTTLTKHVPVITSFSTAKPTSEGDLSVGATEKIQIAWASVYATSAWLQGPNTQKQWYTNPSAAEYVPFQPGVDLYNQATDKSQIPGKARFTLTLTGFNPFQRGVGVSKSFELDVLPIKLLYFKYSAKNEKGGLSFATWQTDPSDWPGVVETAGGNGMPDILTVYQPGKRVDTFYLGPDDKSHPQIQYLSSTKDADGWTLTWITANLTSLTLNGESQTAIASGSKQVTRAGTYKLVGTSPNGGTIQSVLVISAPETLNRIAKTRLKVATRVRGG